MTRFLYPAEAVVAAGWLRSAGFDVELTDYYLCSLNWMYIIALGGFGLDLDEHQREILSCPPPEREEPSEEDLAHYARIERRRRLAVWITLFIYHPYLFLLALAVRWLTTRRTPARGSRPK